MDEGTRPIRLRGTPAGVQRHRASLIVLTVCMGIGFLMEYKRKPGGHFDRVVHIKEDQTDIREQLRIESLFSTPLYRQDGTSIVRSNIKKEAEDMIEGSFRSK